MNWNWYKELEFFLGIIDDIISIPNLPSFLIDHDVFKSYQCSCQSPKFNNSYNMQYILKFF